MFFKDFVLFALCKILIRVQDNPKLCTTEKTVFRLQSNYDSPIIGLGTQGILGDNLDKVLTIAFEKGYRHIDTSFHYRNEETIGKFLKKWFEKGGKREEVFVTTRLPYYGIRPESVEKYLNLSLENLGLKYVDMYLIHTPFGVCHKPDSYELDFNEDGTVKLDTPINHVAIWKEMEKQVNVGRVKSIGLSNFNKTQISNILCNAKIKPSNLQVEVHAYHQQHALRQFCEKHGIVVTAYAPLASSTARRDLRPEQNPDDFPSLFTLPVVKEIAKSHNKSAAQILLRHTIQGKTAVIPSSKNPNHLGYDLEIFNFKLTENEVQQLNALDRGDDGKIFTYKDLKGIENHPQYPFANLK